MDRIEVSLTDSHTLDSIYRLRVLAWRARAPNFPAMERWCDDFDKIARH
jgi:hypothetical protein